MYELSEAFTAWHAPVHQVKATAQEQRAHFCSCAQDLDQLRVGRNHMGHVWVACANGSQDVKSAVGWVCFGPQWHSLHLNVSLYSNARQLPPHAAEGDF